jgi:hypothetical protein
MSEQELKNNKIAEVRLTAKEFDNMQALAVQESEPILHSYSNGGVTVHVAVSFLITFGYLDLISF